MVEEPANVARFLAAMGEATGCPAAHRGPVPRTGRAARSAARRSVTKRTLGAAGCRRPRSGGSRTGTGHRAAEACASSRIEATGILPSSSSEPSQGPPGSVSARKEACSRKVVDEWTGLVLPTRRGKRRWRQFRGFKRLRLTLRRHARRILPRAPANMPLSPGTRLGPYEVLSPLGAGGMGEVYHARDPRIGREVAIKVIATGGEENPDRVRRFEDEARAAGAVNHPNILSVFDVGDDGGAPYVVFELLEGQTLRQRLASGALPVRKVVDYATQIARGLAAAHEKGIVHRDLKPENVFVTKAGHVKILDFGLAKLRRAGPLDEFTRRSDPLGGHGAGDGAGHGRVHVAGAGAREDGGPAVRHLLVRGHPVRDAERRRAFRGASSVETLNAILKEEPPELRRTTADVPCSRADPEALPGEEPRRAVPHSPRPGLRARRSVGSGVGSRSQRPRGLSPDGRCGDG